MRRRKSSSGSLIADINITPFTDVVLVLLIIFMVATPLIYQSKLKINLPSAKEEKSDEKPMKVTISVTEKGEVYIENTKFTLPAETEAFKAKIITIAGSSADSTVIINGDRESKYDSIMRVIDAAKETGIKRIMLGTQVRK